jgi:hypothetical protein
MTTENTGLPEQFQQEHPTEDVQPAATKSSIKLTAGLIGAILLLVGFFTPWVSALIYSVSAFDIVFGIAGKEAGAERFVFLILPLVGILFLIHAFVKKMDAGLINVIKFAPLLLVVIYTVRIIYYINKDGGLRSGDFSQMIQMFGIGIWCTLIGAIVLCFHKEK